MWMSNLTQRPRLDKPIYAAHSDLHSNRTHHHAQAPDQDRSTARARRAEPAAAAGTRGVVRQRRLLRRQRPRAGQVRDASSCAPGRRHQGRGGQPVRPVPADLLPGRGLLRARGDQRATAPAPSTEVGSQAHARGDDRHQRAPPRQQPHTGAHSGAVGAQATGHIGAPAKHRARYRAEKKR